MLLRTLFHHRWALPIVAEAAALGGGARFVQFAQRLGMSRETLQSTLTHLLEVGLIERNPGYGHPLRPEYLLTGAGAALAPRAAAFLKAVRTRGLDDLALRKYPAETLLLFDEGAHRFGELRAALDGVTPAALSQTLRLLEGEELIVRGIVDTWPPATRYSVNRRGAGLVPYVRDLRAA